MGLSLDQSFVGHSHNLCATLTPEYSIGRTESRMKLCVWDGVTISLLKVLPDHRRWPFQDRYPKLLGVLSGIIIEYPLEFPYHRFRPDPEMYSIISWFFLYSPFHPNPKWSLMFMSPPIPSTPMESLLSPISKEIRESLWTKNIFDWYLWEDYEYLELCSETCEKNLLISLLLGNK